MADYFTAANALILISNLIVLGLCLKLYTEILKEKAQRNRNG